MAVDVTQLAAALRLSDGADEPAEPQLSILTRLLGVSEAFVSLKAGAAPQATKDEAVVSMASYMYDRPKAAPETRYSNAWVHSGAASLVAPWVIQRLGDASGEDLPPSSGGGLSDAERARLLPAGATDGQVAIYRSAGGLWVAEELSAGGGGTEDLVARAAAAAAAQDVVDHDSAGDSHEDIRDAIDGRVTPGDVETTAQRLIDSAGHATNVDLGVVRDGIQRNADNLTTHEGTPHGGGNGGTPTPTPPSVLVDALVYSAHGDVTAAGWRDYDFVQLFYAVGGNTYMTPPVNTVQLIGLSPLVFGMSRNVAWTLAISTTDDDVINVTQSTQGNTVPAPSGTSTMTVIAWRS